MAKIIILPPHVVAKIAAGEVIERPAYAVKELIENSIDAGATAIHISIEQAGLKKIQVIDNGEGMDQADLEQSIQPHTTSKLHDEQLLGITTLGFRGEALASLAAVSELSIKSRTSNSATGNEIVIHNGQVQRVIPIGMPEGTIVTAEHLFANIPARKKFLKSPQTEARHIIEVVEHYAAAFPQIHFRLVHNARTILDVPAVLDNTERFRKLVGKDIFDFFIPVHAKESYITLSGFVAKPQQVSYSPSKQFLFVNNRKVTDKTISLAVKESFGTMIESTMYPLFLLFLEIPPQFVDVNIHPRKEQVSFINNATIFSTVKQAIQSGLQENNLTFQNLSWKRSGVGTTNSYAATVLREQILEKETIKIERKIPLVQYHQTYIAAQTQHGIVFFDQHASHERILFEKLTEEFNKLVKSQKSLRLKNPLTLNILKSEQMLIAEYQKVFEKLGFRFSRHLNNKITHIPSLLRDRNIEEVIKNLCVYIEKDLPTPTIDQVSQEMLAFLACRAAVKAGDILEQKAMKSIITKLETTKNNATCPHGRPTRIFYSMTELNRLFKR